MMESIHNLEVLAQEVRDHDSKRMILEAIASYKGGALRAAIVSTWIAVIFDIIKK